MTCVFPALWTREWSGPHSTETAVGTTGGELPIGGITDANKGGMHDAGGARPATAKPYGAPAAQGASSPDYCSSGVTVTPRCRLSLMANV